MAAILGGCLVAGGCSSGGGGEGRDAKTPLVLVSIDTLRADVVTESAAPHLARFRSEALDFAHAYSEIPFTLPAHATLLTGVAPDGHGLFSADDRLPTSRRTLAEILSARGYRTAAVVSSDWLRPGFGFGRGFDTYQEVPLALTFAAEVTRLGMESLDEIRGEAAVPMLFLHYYDAHSDFDLDGNRRAYFSSVQSSQSLSAECGTGQCTADGDCATGFLLWANRNPSRVTAEHRQCLAQSYGAGVRDIDRAFGALRSELERRSLYDQALVVVTSDHGEEFGEHGQYIHAQPFVESLAIPLWIKPPGRRRGRSIESPAQLADLAPTILGLLGLPDVPGMTGRNLLLPANADELLVLGQNKYRPQRYSAQRGRWKLIHDFIETRSALYDLENDPREMSDVAVGHPEVVAGLLADLQARRAELKQVSAASQSQGDDVLTPEAKRRLEALGYVN